MTARFLLRTLGALELRALDDDGRPGDRLLGPGKPLALLAFCCSAREREHSRDALATLLWSDSDPTRARQNLRQALWRVRRATGDLVSVRDDAVVGVASTIATDRERCLDALHRGDIRAALEAYEGPFLSGLSFPGGDEFDEWASLERRHLEDQLVRAAEPFLQSVLRGGKPSLARSLAERLVLVAADHVDAHRVAAECCLGAGNHLEARRIADQLERLLQTQGLRLSAAVGALLARVRDPELTQDEGRPSPLSLDLVGREEAFATAMTAWQRARRGETQIIVIGGVAGIGKSRLLTAIADRCGSRRVLSVSLRANPGERELPFGFAAALASALAALPGAAGIGAESARELVALDPGLGSVFHTTPSQLDGGEAVRRRALAIVDLIAAITEQEPLALFMDDLHWADPASRQLLAIVLGRVVGMPLLVVGTTRGQLAGLVDERTVLAIPLGPLARGDVIDAIRSSGSWPDAPEVSEFIETVAESCDGIPLQVVERLALVEERGLLRRSDGEWSAPDWTAAIAAASVSSPVDHRLRECSAEERLALLILSVVGAPLEKRTIDAALAEGVLPRGQRLDTTTLLRSLEEKGLAAGVAGQWAPSHDVVSEQMMSLASPVERIAAHRSVGSAFALRENAEGAPAAVRHFLVAGEESLAGAQFARVVQRARANGDRRSIQELLAALTGESPPSGRSREVLGSVRLRHRISWPHPAVTVACALLAVTVTAAVAWSATRKPALSFAQAPLMMSPAPLLGPDAYQLVPAAVITTAEVAQPGQRAAGIVRVRSLSPDVELLAIDSAVMKDGRAAFGAFRLRTSATSARLRFESDAFAPLDLQVPTSDRPELDDDAVRASARVVSGRINGVSLDGAAPQVRTARGEQISGVVQLEYDAPWRSASVWLSVTPTWGNPEKSGREVTPVMTPVRQEVIDVPFNVTAPAERGRWWLLLLIDAEPAGGYALSGTNWLVERPVWGDGNDVATLDPAVIRDAVSAGRLSGWRALPAGHPAEECRAQLQRIGASLLRYCCRDAALAGIEVIVK